MFKSIKLKSCLIIFAKRRKIDGKTHLFFIVHPIFPNPFHLHQVHLTNHSKHNPSNHKKKRTMFGSLFDWLSQSYENSTFII